jgi:hypothetical protein
LISVNPATAESDLVRIEPEGLKSMWGAFQPEIIAAVARGDMPIAVRGKEIWRTLAMSLLGLLVVESCLATWTGRQR